MKTHTKIYLEAFGFTDTDFIPSEVSGHKAVDIHHIIGRGRLGTNRIENLMALTREEHLQFGDKKHYMVALLTIHETNLMVNDIEYDKAWFKKMISKYEN